MHVRSRNPVGGKTDRNGPITGPLQIDGEAHASEAVNFEQLTRDPIYAQQRLAEIVEAVRGKHAATCGVSAPRTSGPYAKRQAPDRMVWRVGMTT